jgi:hypothetical protein
MMISLKNFIIPNFIIRSICRDLGCYPIDVSISICSQPTEDTSSVLFNVSDNFSRKQANLIILNKYLANFENIHGIKLNPDVVNAAMLSCSLLCDMYFDNSEYNIPQNTCNDANFPFYFIASKNIIFPYFNIELKKRTIICDPQSFYDYIVEDNKLYFGFKNLKIEFRDAFVMMGIDDFYRTCSNDGADFLGRSLNNSDVMRMLFGFSLPYFNGDEYKADVFFGILHMYSDSPVSQNWIESRFSNIKTARSDMDGNFWIYGLIEKMLAPARGPDFTIYKKWAPITQEVWSNIEDARKKAGLTGATLAFMLKVKDHVEYDDNRTIQALIEDMRS